MSLSGSRIRGPPLLLLAAGSYEVFAAAREAAGGPTSAADEESKWLSKWLFMLWTERDELETLTAAACSGTAGGLRTALSETLLVAY